MFLPASRLAGSTNSSVITVVIVPIGDASASDTASGCVEGVPAAFDR